jgi:SAM-dependent methyltransferase
VHQDKKIEAGQAVYSPLVLGIYDFYVLGLSNHLLWRCPTRELRQLYDRNVSARHIDIGVGTGYFLDKAHWPVPDPAITLVDLNPNSLRAAAQRIARFSPTEVLANALDPLPLAGKFDSAGLCYLFHCLPGTFREKGVVLSHLQPLLAPRARIFGATILQGSAPRSFAAQALMNAYNRRGIFSNANDRIEDLDALLRSHFDDVEISLHGTVALFQATARPS